MLKLKDYLSKVIASLIVFAIVLSNASILLNYGVTLATVSKYGKQTSNENISFDTYFLDDGENKGYVYQSSMDNEDLAIELNAVINDAGYLKNASIEISSDTNLNFEIGEIEENDLVESVQGTLIKLNQINHGETLNLSIPIKYKDNESLDNLSNDTVITLNGIYVDNDGNSSNISEPIYMNLGWISNSEVTISSELSKFVKYSSDDTEGLIAQTIITIGLDKQNIPVSKTEISLDALNVDGLNLEKVTVISNDREEFSTSNWNYNTESNKIDITIDTEEIVSDTETFVITYVFSDEKVEFPIEIESEINCNMLMKGTSENISGVYLASYNIEDEIGDIVTYSSQATTSELSKGDIIANKYSEENSYSTEYGYNYIINIADTTLMDKIVLGDINEVALSDDDNDENEHDLNKTSYYKEVKISKSDFENILGEDGVITIYNKEDSSVITTINKDTEIDDNEFYTINISEAKASKVKIETSTPVGTGNLEIELNKEIIDTDYSIDEIKSFEKIENETGLTIYYEGDVESNAQKQATSINLLATNTNATLSVNRTSLSTIVKNEDVELKVEFNNDELGTDFYKNPVFEIVFPEAVTDINVTKVSVINADDVFEVKNTTIIENESGMILRVELEGTEIDYSLNTITNGTNLLINADITLDIYSPSEDANIVLNYTNEDATSYEGTDNSYGTSIVPIELVAPSGVVSVSTISDYTDYNGEDSEVTSVEQGTVIDKIEIYADSQKSTMNILVMNNNDNNIKDVRILGRIPFEGNTNVETGEDLGTTLNTTMSSYIQSDSSNDAGCTIYYSENENATDDLEDSSNGWSEVANNLSNVKSYLIVLDSEYEMQSGETLKYSYQYTIPENLEHNEDLYANFATYYINETDVATTSEVSVADVVGLTTGTGPQLSLETSVNVGSSDVAEYEYITYSVTVTNTGEETADNVVINVPVPNRTTFASYVPSTSVEVTGGWSLDSSSEKNYNVGSLKAGESQTYEFYAQVNKLPTIEEYYASYDGFTKNEDGTYSLYEEYTDEDGEVSYKETVIDGLPDVYTEFTATVTAKDLAKALTSNTTSNKVIKSEVIVSEEVKTETTVVNVNDEMTYTISVKNNTDETMKNIKIEKTLPSELTYSEAYVVGYESDGITVKKINSVSYDKNTRKVTWTIDSLDSGRTAYAKLVVITNDLADDVYQTDITTYSTIKVNDNEYKTGEITTTLAKPKLVISQVADVTNKYVTEGQVINYTFTIKNEGLVKAQSVSVVDNLPSKVKIKSLSYVSDGIEIEKTVSSNEDATVYTSIQPESELVINVKAVTLSIDSTEETITNYATITTDNTEEETTTNEVTHIIEKTSSSSSDSNSNTTKTSSTNSGSTASSSTYKITGSAWLDNDKDGAYSSNDVMISDLEVMLINASTGKQISSTTTSNTGLYTFSGLSAGKYYVGFFYNSSKYGLTEYKKDGVANNLNSDAYASEINGKVAGLTDVVTISNTSISNIDVGLIEATVFDLSLEKTVSKVTVTNNSGTTKTTFNSEMAKIDIPSKYLASSKVYIEYNITITNEGELAGYAKQVVDYKDSSLSFSSDSNTGWYEGSDGNLYNDSLADTILQPGESITLTLVLTKQMTTENTGVINNTAEISKAYNSAGISDRDSTPGNNAQSEDDYGSADTIISVKTGESLIYISAIIITAVVAIITTYVVYKNRRKIKRVFKTRKVVG